MVVLDSSFLVAYHNTRDVHHPAAAATMQRVAAGEWGRALVLEYVLAEVATVLLARRGLETAARVAAALLGSREVDFAPCSNFFSETLETFTRQANGSLSFVDAAIVVVASRHPPALVATFDADFRQIEGITVVPA